MSECKRDGENVGFVEPLDVQGTLVRIVYKGKLSGGEIAFTRWVGDFPPETFTAKRVKESSPELFLARAQPRAARTGQVRRGPDPR